MKGMYLGFTDEQNRRYSRQIILPGIVGAIRATEVIKLILGLGEALVGRLLVFEALRMEFYTARCNHRHDCALCGDNPTIKELIDYEQFCGIPSEQSQTPAI